MSVAARRRRRKRQQAAAERVHRIPGQIGLLASTDSTVPVHARVLDYGPDRHEADVVETAAELERYLNAETVSWINIDSLEHPEQIASLAKRLGVHALWIEDCLNPSSRPKAEILGDQMLVVARVCRILDDGTLDTEQVSLILGPTWLLSIQERPGDVWDGVRKRLANGVGRLRTMGADYLLHAMLDAMVDNDFLVLEAMERQVDAAEDRAVMAPSGALPVDFMALKQELSGFRQSVWPMREAIGSLMRNDTAPIAVETQPFYRDLYDHIVQVMDIVDATRERLTGVVELNLALQGQRLNEIMKVLTLVSTVFIPLGFLAGLYGMNFEWMPELKFAWGYPVMLGIMGTIGLVMALWIRSRKWF